MSTRFCLMLFKGKKKENTEQRGEWALSMARQSSPCSGSAPHHLCHLGRWLNFCAPSFSSGFIKWDLLAMLSKIRKSKHSRWRSSAYQCVGKFQPGLQEHTEHSGKEWGFSLEVLMFIYFPIYYYILISINLLRLTNLRDVLFLMYSFFN
jgi:hypothetical protein